MNVSERSLSEVLHSSLEMLQKRPILFLPKLVTSMLGAVWFIGFIESYGSNIHYLVSMPFLIFMSVFVSALVSSMVKGINNGENNLLKFALHDLRPRLVVLFTSAMILLVVTFLISLPISLGLFFYLLTGSLLYLASGGIITLLLSFLLAYKIYFLPATLVSTESTVNAFKQSFSSSKSNRSDVVKLTVFSFILLVLASASSGIGETLGYLGFIVGRLLSSIVSTYLYVISPSYYFSD